MKSIRGFVGGTAALSLLLGLLGPLSAFAATSPTLGLASTFSVISGTDVTNTGATFISGSVGISPAGGGGYVESGTTTFTGGGSIHDSDTAADNAQAADTAAFTSLNAGSNADANCIGGVLPDATELTSLAQPLAPGVYCSAGSYHLTGHLSLLGTNGTWVFKTVSTLITAPGSSVTGGDPCNIWWRVGSSATIDTTTGFEGNVLALTSISMNTGATLNGRIFAQTAGVTLQANTISGPVCSAATTSSTR